ncbi:MAG: response regulator [Syntrophobacteraceae bacterium]
MHTLPVILVCDDDHDDQLLIEHAFAEACIDAEFRFTSDGVELTEYLQKSNEDGKSPCPDIILLDLNMPRMDGSKTLEWIKSHPHHRAVPVVIYTTSREPMEIQRCYGAGANSFMTKCSNFEDLVDKVKAFSKYWTETAELPRIAGCKY